jgi:hypothetical protein
MELDRLLHSFGYVSPRTIHTHCTYHFRETPLLENFRELRSLAVSLVSVTEPLDKYYVDNYLWLYLIAGKSSLIEAIAGVRLAIIMIYPR